MIARKCDRCGAFYEPYSNWTSGSALRDQKPSGIMFTLTTETNTEWTRSEWNELPDTGNKTKDLCPCCMEALLAWWNAPKNEPVIVYEPIGKNNGFAADRQQ